MLNRILKLSFGVTFVLVMSCDELAEVFGEQIEGDWRYPLQLSMRMLTVRE